MRVSEYVPELIIQSTTARQVGEGDFEVASPIAARKRHTRSCHPPVRWELQSGRILSSKDPPPTRGKMYVNVVRRDGTIASGVKFNWDMKTLKATKVEPL